MAVSGSGAVAREMQIRANLRMQEAEDAAAFVRSQEKEVDVLLARVARLTEENRNLHTRMVDAVQAAERAQVEIRALKEALGEAREAGRVFREQREEALGTVQLCKKAIEAGEEERERMVRRAEEAHMELEETRGKLDAARREGEAARREADALKEAASWDAELGRRDKEEREKRHIADLEAERGGREEVGRALEETRVAMLVMSDSVKGLEAKAQELEGHNRQLRSENSDLQRSLAEGQRQVAEAVFERAALERRVREEAAIAMELTRQLEVRVGMTTPTYTPPSGNPFTCIVPSQTGVLNPHAQRHATSASRLDAACRGGGPESHSIDVFGRRW